MTNAHVVHHTAKLELNMQLSRLYNMGVTPIVGGDMCLATYQGVKAKCSDKFTLVQKKKKRHN